LPLRIRKSSQVIDLQGFMKWAILGSNNLEIQGENEVLEKNGDTNGDIPDLAAIWDLLSEDERKTIESIVLSYCSGNED